MKQACSPATAAAFRALVIVALSSSPVFSPAFSLHSSQSISLFFPLSTGKELAIEVTRHLPGVGSHLGWVGSMAYRKACQWWGGCQLTGAKRYDCPWCHLSFWMSPSHIQAEYTGHISQSGSSNMWVHIFNTSTYSLTVV